MKQTRQPRKLILASEAAKLLGYKSGQTVKRMREAGIVKGYRRPNAGPTTPWKFSETEILVHRDAMGS